MKGPNSGPWQRLHLYSRNDDESFKQTGAFVVSAPGKVIICGEHAVVFGKSAIAAAISLRSYLSVTPQCCSAQRTVTLQLPDIDFELSWNIDSLPWPQFDDCRSRKYTRGQNESIISLDPNLVARIKPLIPEPDPSLPASIQKTREATAMAFLYMFTSISSPMLPGTKYTFRSQIPIGAGLGSSASLTVCLAAAILHQMRVVPQPSRNHSIQEAQIHVETINKWAFLGELCIHGNPSGIDNTISTKGKALLFRRGTSSASALAEPLPHFPELSILLVDTRQPRLTSAELAKVAALREALPAVSESLLNAIDAVTTEVHQRFLVPSATSSACSNSGRGDPEQDSASPDHLGTLLRINHGLLSALGVSHPRLERICEIVAQAGIGNTKLTGSGGGGCAIVLLNSATSEGSPGRRLALSRVEMKLQEEGFTTFETTVAGPGVGVKYCDSELDLKMAGERLLNGHREMRQVAGFEAHDGDHGMDEREMLTEQGWLFWGR